MGTEARNEGVAMIVLGVILLVLGLIFSLSILWTIGIILIVAGVVLWIFGALGRQIGPRRYYF
jgi:uncharacterized membrane protein HdeD (DUF308 family)